VSITWKRGPAKPGVVGRSTAASGWSIRLPPGPGQVGGHADAEVAQRGGGADARTHHDGRAGVGACRHHDRISLNDLPIGKPDSARDSSAQLDPVHGGAGPDGQVGLVPGRRQVCQRRAHPQAIAHVPGARARTHRARLVVVADQPVTGGDSGIGEGPLQRRQFAGRRPADRDRPADPVPVAAEIGVGLDGAEDRQQISERPARVAPGRPLVVVLRPSPQREARVGRRTTAHQASPGQRDRTPALVRLR